MNFFFPCKRKKIISALEKGQYNKLGGPAGAIIDILAAQDIEYRNIYTELFFTDKIPAPAKIVINKYTNDHQNSLVPHMHFMAMVFDVVKSLQAYKKAVMNK